MYTTNKIKIKPLFIKLKNLSKQEIQEIQKNISKKVDSVNPTYMPSTTRLTRSKARLLKLDVGNTSTETPVRKTAKRKLKKCSIQQTNIQNENEHENKTTTLPTKSKTSGFKSGGPLDDFAQEKSIDSTKCLVRSTAGIFAAKVEFETAEIFITKTKKRKIENDDREGIKKRKPNEETFCEKILAVVSKHGNDIETHSLKFKEPTAELKSQVYEAPISLTVAPIMFKIGEVVWAKIKGYPAWPAKIKAFSSNKKMVIVVWFNDYRITKMYQTKLFKFLVNFDTYAQNFDNVVGLKKAAHEALIFYGCMLNQANDM